MDYLGIVVQTLVEVHQPTCSCCQTKLFEDCFSLQQLKTFCARTFVFESRCQNCSCRAEISWDLYLKSNPKSLGSVEFSKQEGENLKEEEVLAEAMFYLTRPTN